MGKLAQKFKKNKSHRRGTDYELALLMLFLKRAVENYYNFDLATERKEDEKFDDLFLRIYGSAEKIIYFLQAKYTDDTSKKITHDELKTKSDTKFGLLKYFNSYRKIRKKAEFQEDLESLNFIICTTIHLDSDDLKKGSIEVIEVEENDGIFKKDNKEKLGWHYKLKINTDEEKQNIFKDSSLKEVANKLAECTLEGKNINVEQLSIIKRYHVALAKEVIDIEKKEFHQKFLDDPENLSKNAKEFRNIFYESAWEFLRKKQDSLEKLHPRERKKAEKILDDFKEVINKKPDDEANQNTFWKKLENKALILIGGFGKLEIKKDDKLVEEFAKIIKAPKDEAIEVNKNTNLGKNINKLAGYILIMKNDVIKFNEGFLKNKELPASFEKFRSQLREKLGEDDFDRLNQCELKFNFKNEDDTRIFKEKIKEKSYWDLDDDYLEDKVVDPVEIDEFLERLVFVVTPKVDELKKAIKDEMRKEFGSMNGKNIYSTLYTKLVDWINYRDEEGNGYYLSHENNVYDKAKNSFFGSVWFDVREPVESFTGRTKELNDLHNAVQQNSDKVTVVSQTTLISGLGGIGKTELVRKYIDEHSQDYDNNVVWINAVNYKTFIESFLRLAKDKLGIPTKNINGQEKDIKSIVQDVYKFFAKRKSLFIFDNAEKYRTQQEEDTGIDKFLPSSSLPPNANKPCFIITSRNQKWGNIKVLQLDTFTEEEVIEFIKKTLNIKEDSQNKEIKQLAETLQRSPPALQQAVAYIREKDEELKNMKKEFKISDYLKKYEEINKLLGFKFLEGNSNPYTRTTFITWEITLETIKKKKYGEKSLEILNAMAYFAPNDIPVEIFLGLMEGDEKLGSTVQLLKQYSMVSSGEEQAMLNIHRLVQQVTRLKLRDQNKEEETLRKALGLLDKAIEAKNLNHAVSAWNYASKYDELVNKFSELPCRIISKLDNSMRYEEAYLFGKRVSKLLKIVLGLNHPDTLKTIHNIAGVLDN